MRQILLFTAAVLLCSPLFAQQLDPSDRVEFMQERTVQHEDGTESVQEVTVLLADTTDYQREVYVDKFENKDRVFGKNRLRISFGENVDEAITTIKGVRRAWYSGHWAGFGLGYAGLVSNLGDLHLPSEGSFLAQSPKSISVQLNLIDVAIVRSRRVALITGLGFEFNNYRLANNIGLQRVDGVLMPDYQYEDRGVNLKKSKLVTAYMNIPLLVEVTFGSRDRFFINGGVIGGVLLNAHTKIKANSNGMRGKYKNHRNLGIQNFHYGVALNFGVGPLAITTSYYPHSLFRSSDGPHVEQVNVGLMLCFW